jgi:hypothetical protein
MGKLDNYIYYTICEKSYELFEKSNYLTYNSFCNGIKFAIKLNDLSYDENQRIVDILKHVSLIYDLKYSEAGEYIHNYFMEEKFLIFEEPVRLISEYFKNSLN